MTASVATYEDSKTAMIREYKARDNQSKWWIGSFRSSSTEATVENKIELNRKQQRLYDYLVELITEQSALAVSAQAAYSVLNDLLRRNSKSIDIPVASVGVDGEVFLIWDKAEHHLEIESYGSERVELFYRNRATKELWSAIYPEIQLDDLALQSKLSLFAIA